MGGSLGMAAGEAIIKALDTAAEKSTPFILFAASGGARMQEGILSLMQMPRTTVAVPMLREAKLPYIVVLTNPTTGGVTASYAMLGDVHIAEPGALIGFAGPRVIEQTIREKLPEGFQRAEYLREHGMVDMVVHRQELRATISRLCRLMTKAPAAARSLPVPAARGRRHERGRSARPGALPKPDHRAARAAAPEEDRPVARPSGAPAGPPRPSRAEAAAGHPRRRHQRQGLGDRVPARDAGSGRPRACTSIPRRISCASTSASVSRTGAPAGWSTTRRSPRRCMDCERANAERSDHLLRDHDRGGLSALFAPSGRRAAPGGRSRRPARRHQRDRASARQPSSRRSRSTTPSSSGDARGRSPPRRRAS